MNNALRLFSVGLLSISSVVLIALEMHTVGWILLGVCACLLLLTEKQFAKDIFLILIGLLILGVTPINTDISVGHMLYMGTTLVLAILIPYLVSRYIYWDYVIKYPWHFARTWHQGDFVYVVSAAVMAYLLLPFYLVETGAYLNWPAVADLSGVLRLFIGTNALGIWDELFFINTVLALLRKYFSFWMANIFQAIMFTSFLYELGFTGWIFPIIFVFALLQGYIFSKTHSLFYIVTIHLIVDFFLFLAILHAHHPQSISIFLN